MNPLLPITLVLAPIVVWKGYTDYQKDKDARNQEAASIISKDEKRRVESQLRFRHVTGQYINLVNGDTNFQLRSDGKSIRWTVDGWEHKAKHIRSRFLWNEKENFGALERTWITDKLTIKAIITDEQILFFFESEDFPDLVVPWLRRDH